MQKELYQSVVKHLSSLIKGTQFENHTFCVGGCVRDELMDNEIKDIDIAVSLEQGGIHLAEYLYSIHTLKQQPVTYPSYSTAMFVLKEFPDVELEAVQTRKEKYEDKTNRNPVTAFGTQEEDCYRRDLTINSLYKNVSTGEIIDITGKGLSDIKNEIIRTPLNPDETFDDDPLRMLRVIRFASRYGWDISQNTFDSIKKNASRLEIISRERVHDELNKMMSTNLAGYAMQLIIESGLFQYVFNVQEQSQEIYDDIIHNVSGISYTNYQTRLVALFIAMNIDENEIERIMKSLKYSTNDILYVKKLFSIVVDNISVDSQNTIGLLEKYGDEGYCRYIKYLCGNLDTFSEVCKLLIPCLSTDNDNIIMMLYHSIENEKDNNQFFGFKLYLTGLDIMKYLDIKPSATVGNYLSICMDEVFKNPDITKDELLTFIKDYHNEKRS